MEERFSLEAMLPCPYGSDDIPELRHFEGIPGIAYLKTGRIVVVFYGGIQKDEEAGNQVYLLTSDDGGISWQYRYVVKPDAAHGSERAFDSEVWVDPEGCLWWFWAQARPIAKRVVDGRCGVWASRCDNATGEQWNWEHPRRIGEGIMLNKPLVCSNGNWLFPSALWHCMRHDTPEELQRLVHPNVFISHDKGRSFEFVPGPEMELDARGIDEHAIVERRDGTLWMLIRTMKGVWQSFSADGGYTWTEAQPSNMGSTVSRFAFMRLKSGKLLYVHHQSPQLLAGESYTALCIRNNLTAWYSDDDGKTWKGRLVLDERPEVSYPSVAEGENGFIYVVYDRNRYKTGQILMSRFTEKDLEAGEFLTPGSFRQNTVASFEYIQSKE